MSFIKCIHTSIALLRRRRENYTRGAAMVEYAFLIAGVAAVVAFAVGIFGSRLMTLFGTFF